MQQYICLGICFKDCKLNSVRKTMERQLVIDIIAIMIVPVLFVFGLFFAPNGVWKMGSKLKSNELIRKNMQAAQKREVKEIADRVMADLDDSEKADTFASYQLQKLQTAISYTINRHDWYEAQRSGLLTKHLTLSGLAFTAIGLYVGQQKTGLPLESKLVIFSIGLLLLISLLYAIHLYNSELDQDRPYRLVSDIRFWYYRYSLPDAVKRYGERLDFQNIADDVLKEREKFLNRATENSDLQSSLREDFEQLFILHILVKHKSESLQKIRWAFFSTTAFLSFSAVWFFVYFNFLRSCIIS